MIDSHDISYFYHYVMIFWVFRWVDCCSEFRVSFNIHTPYSVHIECDTETLSKNDNEKLAKHNLSIWMCCFHKNPMRSAVTWLRTQFGLKCLMTMLTVVTVLVCHETEPAHDLIGSDQIWIDSVINEASFFFVIVCHSLPEEMKNEFHRRPILWQKQ